MIILIGGASHTGKTLLAQRLLEKYHYPYLSIDHLILILNKNLWFLLRRHRDSRCPFAAIATKAVSCSS